MIIIISLCIAVACVLAWNVLAQHNKPEQPKLIDISSGHRMFVAKSEQDAVNIIQSKSNEASCGDICYVRYSDGGAVKTIAGIYNVVGGTVSITYLK